MLYLEYMLEAIRLWFLKRRHVETPYNHIVEIYHKKHFDEKMFDRFIDEFANMLPKHALVLDAGTGTGGETKKLLAHRLQVKSIDIAEKMLVKARKEVPRGEFIKMDVMNLEFPDNYFDGIWSARTLIHIPTRDQGRVLDGFYRVLKENGIVCITVLGGEKEGIEPEYYDPTHRLTTFFKYFHEGELETYLKNHGFKVLKSFTSFDKESHEPHLTVIAIKPSY